MRLRFNALGRTNGYMGKM